MLKTNQADPVVGGEVARRRTFAIISHPDAGKTTLTEKLLLYTGCVDVAGAVRGRKAQRAVASDWMELERQRGISVSSTVLTFEHQGQRVNLLDTPGHQDFSEDTYRTLMAADCAVMVIDLAKGIEAQTEKLFRICAMRKIPILTFVNKVDRPGKDPFELLAEIEKVLGTEAVPYNWPVGTGFDFCGVYHWQRQRVQLFERGSGDSVSRYEEVDLRSAGHPLLSDPVRAKALEDIELLDVAGTAFDQQRFLRGEMTPVFFGSALNNYGVEQFLQAFLELSPPPAARPSDLGPIPAERPEFAGFVFKIQANLDPRHRDRIAFVRVCAGRFARDMEVLHTRTGKKIRIRRSHRVFAKERETMDEAFPGDIIGMVNPGDFRLGDTLCTGTAFNYEPLPQFSPEHFAVLRCQDTLRRKQFTRGLKQLVEEGAIQVLVGPESRGGEPILAAVGELQFDVVRFRLQSEYDAQTTIQWLPYKLARWVTGEPAELEQIRLPYTAKKVLDRDGHWVVLFSSQWDLNYCADQNPSLRWHQTSALDLEVESCI